MATSLTWACQACTFENQPEHLACAICTAERSVAPKVMAAATSTKGAAPKTTPAPPESFAAKASRSALLPTPVVAPSTKTQQRKVSGPAKVLRGLQGWPMELKELKAGEKSTGRFHIVFKSCTYNATAQQIATALDRSYQPYAIKRVVTNYYVGEGKNSVEHDYPATPSEAKDPLGKSRAFIEFYPAKELQQQLRASVGWCRNAFRSEMEKDEELAAVFGNAFAVPFFVDSKAKRRDGREVCPSISKLCKSKQCTYAHEPEDWGIERFDGHPASETRSPGPPARKQASDEPTRDVTNEEDAKALQRKVYEENVRLLEEAARRKEAREAEIARQNQEQSQQLSRDEGLNCDEPLLNFVCNGCGESLPNRLFKHAQSPPNATRFCIPCEGKGVPKKECVSCLFSRFLSEFNEGANSCVVCEREGDSGAYLATALQSRPVFGKHHVRVDFHDGCVLSNAELSVYFDSALGANDVVEDIYTLEEEGSKTPLGCFVRFREWSYLEMAPRLRQCMPPAGADVQVDDCLHQARIEQLFHLMPESITETEFRVLETHYRSLASDTTGNM